MLKFENNLSIYVVIIIRLLYTRAINKFQNKFRTLSIIFIRETILWLHKNGKSYSEIGKIVNVKWIYVTS